MQIKDIPRLNKALEDEKNSKKSFEMLYKEAISKHESEKAKQKEKINEAMQENVKTFTFK